MQLPAISLTVNDLSRFDAAIQKEWLLTNGLGGYASSTALGVNTRKYHGLLVAALHPPGDRTVCLSKLDEDVCVGDSVFRLGANEFRDGFFPNGHVFLRGFSVSPFPAHVYTAGGVTSEKILFLPWGKNVVVALYKFLNEGKVIAKVRVFPLLTCRHFHAVVDGNVNPLSLQQKQSDRSVEVSWQNPKATTTLIATEGEFVREPNWVRRLFYREEAKRGESSLDDCYQPGHFEISLPPQTSREFAVVAAADENRQESGAALEWVGTNTLAVKRQLDLELRNRTGFIFSFPPSQTKTLVSDWLSWVLSAANSFLVRGVGGTPSVIAGYHWFEAWGRDTFVSLPGLLLVTGRFADAERVLLSFRRYLKGGLIPNFILDKSGEPVYKTVDATLWYVNAVLQYLKYTGNFRFVEETLWQTLKAIVENHEKGTSYGIHMDSEGLLVHGPHLTWMDAEFDGEAVTPRAGKAVEVQALWYNALRTVQLLAAKFGHMSLSWRCSDRAVKARESFNRNFWNPETACLFDVVDPSKVDASLRPNQIIAASLDFPILYRDKAELVVDMVQRELLTPFGLRTLTRNDPKYRGIYEGNRASRDIAYHNGTAWAWLLGPFTTAFLKAKGYEVAERKVALKNFITPLFSQQILRAGLGTVSEIFDGDPPHTPRGCISQAWSVAEPLRAYIEDVLQVRPKFEKKVLQP